MITIPYNMHIIVNGDVLPSDCEEAQIVMEDAGHMMTDKPKRKSSTAQVNRSRSKAFAQRLIYKTFLQAIAAQGTSKEAQMARDALEKGEKL